MTRKRKLELLALAGMMLTAMIWGFAFVVVKNSLDFITPGYMLAFRFTIAGVVLTLIYLKKLKTIGKGVIIRGSIIGFMLFLAEVTQTYGCKYTTAGKNAFLTTVYVVLVPFLNLIICKKPQRGKNVAAALIAFVGIGLISLTERFVPTMGDSLTLICGLFYALQIVLIDKYAYGDDPIALSIFQLLSAAVYSWIYAPIAEGAIPLGAFNTECIVGILYLGLLSTMVGFMLQTVCQKYAPAGPCAIIMGLESVFGATFSAIFLHEIITGRMYAGFLLMFIAIVLCETDIFSPLYPDSMIGSAYDIDYRKLWDSGYRGIIFDIDNTLVTHGAPADDRSTKLLRELGDMGFKILFLSNNKEPRVESFRDKADSRCMYIHKAGKPKKSGYEEAMRLMGTDKSSTVAIGDQIFTDCWGARRSGIYFILTRPIDKKEEIQIILKRIPERMIVHEYATICREREMSKQ